MHFRLRILRIKQVAAVTRFIVAAALVSALLSGVAPLSLVSSSASAQFCTMSCCIGKPAHLAGSCGGSFPDKREAPGNDSSCGAMDMSAGHDDGMMEMRDDADTHVTANSSPNADSSSNHSDTRDSQLAQHSSWQLPFAQTASSQTASSQIPSSQTSSLQSASIASLFMNAPCPPECGAGAGSFAVFRTSRDQAALAHADKPRPPTNAVRFNQSTALLHFSDERRRQSRPRAPPFH